MAGTFAAKGRPPGRRRRGFRDRYRWGRAGRRRRHAVPHGTSTVRVGFIGAGRMGRPMVGRLVEAGHRGPRTGPIRREALGNQPNWAPTRSARSSRSVRDAEAVVLCVFTDEQVRQVCLADGLVAAMPAGSTLVLHTTGSPRTAEAIAEHAAPRGVEVVDAPVSGGPHNAAAGALTLFVGGADDAVAASAAGVELLRRSDLARRTAGRGPEGEAGQQRAVRGADRPALRRRRVGGRGSAWPSPHCSPPSHTAAPRVACWTSSPQAGRWRRSSDAAGEFVGKDIAVVRQIAAELGGDLGVLDDVIDAGVAGAK